MRQYIWLLFLILFIQQARSQNESVYFKSSEKKLDQALAEIGARFNIRYSYADSLVVNKTLKLEKGNYSLDDIHSQITKQTALEIVKIDSRYYSIYQDPLEISSNIAVDEVLIDGFVSRGIRKSKQEIIISPQKVEELPGVPDADILFSLQQLPGVKSPNETASGLHIRGGTPDQNLIMWDGIRMYHPGHLFGMISGFNPNIKQTVHYFNKGTSPEYGERISSVIDIRTTDEIVDSFKADAGINALDADLYLQVPIMKKKLGLQLSGRRSLTEWIQSPTFRSLEDKVFQNTDFNSSAQNTFRFQDYSAKINFEPNESSAFSLTSIVIDNFLDYTGKNETSEPQLQKMDILNYGYSFIWNQRISSRLKQKLLLYYSAYTFDYLHATNPDSNFTRFTKRNRITDSGLELNYDYKISDAVKAGFGYQFFGNDVSHSFTSKTPNLEILLDQKHLFNVSHAGYGSVKYAFRSWDFQAGARYNYYSKLDEDSFEPRLFVMKKLGKMLSWQASFEKKSQVMSQVRESAANDLSLENYVWIISDNKNYPVQRASQLSSGLVFKSISWLIDADAYYKTTTGVTSLTFGFLHQFDSSIHIGNGYTKGLDVLIQKSAPSWRAWLTYTYQDSRNRYEGINGKDYFPVSADISHAFTASIYKQWKSYSASLGWFWHTGKPYSSLNASNEIAAFNDRRLPEYHRLDFSAAYHFYNKKTWTGTAGISILNLYNQHTIISKEYERQYGTISEALNSDYAIKDFYSLGITPNVFVRVSF